jgi:hypothetical protein
VFQSQGCDGAFVNLAFKGVKTAAKVAGKNAFNGCFGRKQYNKILETAKLKKDPNGQNLIC